MKTCTTCGSNEIGAISGRCYDCGGSASAVKSGQCQDCNGPTEVDGVPYCLACRDQRTMEARYSDAEEIRDMGREDF